MRHAIHDTIIHDNTDNQDKQIPNIIVSVKPKGHAHEKCQRGFMLTGVVKTVISKERQRKKQKYKNIGVKKHIYFPFRCMK